MVTRSVIQLIATEGVVGEDVENEEAVAHRAFLGSGLPERLSGFAPCVRPADAEILESGVIKSGQHASLPGPFVPDGDLAQAMSDHGPSPMGRRLVQNGSRAHCIVAITGHVTSPYALIRVQC